MKMEHSADVCLLSPKFVVPQLGFAESTLSRWSGRLRPRPSPRRELELGPRVFVLKAPSALSIADEAVGGAVLKLLAHHEAPHEWIKGVYWVAS